MLERSLVSVSAAPVGVLPIPASVVRDEFGFASSSDPKIARLLRVASAAIAGTTGLGRPFLRQTYLERTWGDGGPLLLLSRWPVESVASVTLGIDDPETITASEYSIALEGRNALFRSGGWAGPCEEVRQRVTTGGEFYGYSVTYTAGWVPPGTGAGYVSAWTANTAYAVGAFAKPLAASNASIVLLYECTTAGTSHASTEPTWPTTAGSTVSDGTVVWTAREAKELPEDFQEAVLVTVGSMMRGSLESAAAGIQSERLGAHEIVYSDSASGRGGLPALPPAAQHLVWSYR